MNAKPLSSTKPEKPEKPLKPITTLKSSAPAILAIATLAFLVACGKYPAGEQSQDQQGKASHGETSGGGAVGMRAGTAELTGQGYEPAFLAAGYATQDVSFEIKETIVDIGLGYKYRALTYDGNFPAATLVVEQGTLLRIRVNNRDSKERSLHTHVIKYKPESDGTAASATLPGQSRTYFWEVTDTTPPGFYPFHDHEGTGEGAQARGLIGMVNVVKKGEAAKAGFGILLHDLDPAYLFSTSGAAMNGSGGGGHGAGGGAGPHGGAGMATGSVPAHLINGRFGDAPESRFSVSKGSKIRLGVVNLGTAIHTFHPHGNFFRGADGAISDNLEILPGGYRTVELDAEAAGEWMYHCHVPGHPEGGMWSRYVVK